MNMEPGTPKTIGIIMDGNRRWAKQKGLLPWQGHSAGFDTLENIVRFAAEAGVKNLIVYAFSTENWGRQEEEVSEIMKLLTFALTKKIKDLVAENASMSFIGDRARFPAAMQKQMAEAEAMRPAEEKIKLIVALSYGGRDEILRAVNKAKTIEGPIDEQTFSSLLDTAAIPDPDIIIRTGGETRLSGFLPWQSVYSELFFTPTLWPDFSKEELFSIIEKFKTIERRNGK